MQTKTQAIIRFILALIVLTGIISVFAWANCNQKETNIQKPIEEECVGGPADVDHDTILEWTTYENYPKKGAMVTFEGYVEMPNMTYLNSGTYLVNLVQDSALSGADVIMMIWEGDCENTMKPIPDDYEDKDLLIFDNDGKEIRHGDKVRATGKVKDDGAMFMFFVKRVEKL